MLSLDCLQFCSLKLLGEMHLSAWIQPEISNTGEGTAFKDNSVVPPLSTNSQFKASSCFEMYFENAAD